MPGSTAQTNKFHTFYLQQRPDLGVTWADIKVNHPLDYENIKEYNLTVRVEVWPFFFTHSYTLLFYLFIRAVMWFYFQRFLPTSSFSVLIFLNDILLE